VGRRLPECCQSLRSEEANARTNNIQTKWLEEHADKIKTLYATLTEVIARFDAIGEQINERPESEDYLNLVRKAFRTWDRADTNEKRNAVRNLISNAAGTRVCSDDVVRLFIDWLSAYQPQRRLVRGRGSDKVRYRDVDLRPR
jgi:uncharacterized membrane-anchored protein YjiN (DUF445 family)